jgi:protein TonB
MDASAENKNRYVALTLTIGFHALLFLLFLFIVFITPIPAFEIKPVPEIKIELGMEGLGNADAGGSGQHDKDIATSQNAAVKPVTNNNTPNVLTDDSDPTAVVKTNPKNKKDNKAEAPIVEEEKPSTELLNALAALKNKNKHVGKGEGDGNTGGSGNGNKQGVGDGGDSGHGDKTPGYNGRGGYDLKGRMLLQKPERMTDSQEEGIVVVEIIVDETGKVIKATPGQRGSTTTSSNLYAKAHQAALTVKFNPSPEGIKEQRGTYTFVFTLE